MDTKKKQFIFLIIGIVLTLGIIVSVAVMTINLNDKNLNGTTFVVGETSLLPNGVSELSFTEIKPQDQTKKSAVSYIHKEDDEIVEVYKEFDTVKEGYDFCNLRDIRAGINNRNINMTLIFFDDWIAEGENGFGESETVGYGKGGAISPYYRESELTINLNGHTLGRSLDKTIDNGSVIVIEDSYNLNICNGYIKGGKTTGNGGGILVNYVGWDTNVYIKNVQIRENQADGYGGGIFTSYQIYDKNSSGIIHDTYLYLNNTSIFYNIAKVGGGGMYSDDYTGLRDIVQVCLESRVFIDNNKCLDNSNHNNYTLCKTDRTTFRICKTQTLTTGSCIYISFNNNTTDTTEFSEECKDVAILKGVKDFFHADDSNRKIILKEYDSSCELCIANNSGC